MDYCLVVQVVKMLTIPEQIQEVNDRLQYWEKEVEELAAMGKAEEIADVYREAKECADKIWTSSRCPKSTYTRKDFVAHEAIKNEALRILTDSYTRGSNHDRAIIDRAFRSDIENYPEMLRIIESKKAQQVRTAEPSNPSACEPKGYSYE